MTAPVDPNAPVQMVGETNANFLCRVQQYSPPASGPNQGMANTWLDKLVNQPAPSGFRIQ